MFSLWRPTKAAGLDRAPCLMVTSTDPVEALCELCDSDENAQTQQFELEVLQSMYAYPLPPSLPPFLPSVFLTTVLRYPDLVQIIRPAPESAGQPCAAFIFHTEKIIGDDVCATGGGTNRSGYEPLHLARLHAQLAIQFSFPSGYPATARPVVHLLIGDLSLFEFDTWLRSTLIERVVQSKNDLHNILFW